MKHLKIYEQYDFDDLSEDEIFGKETWRIIMSNHNNFYYILQEFVSDIDWKVYKNNPQHSSFKENLTYVDHVDDYQIINYYNNKCWNKISFKDLPKDIKDKIKI